jgi:hypothetical protein
MSRQHGKNAEIFAKQKIIAATIPSAELTNTSLVHRLVCFDIMAHLSKSVWNSWLNKLKLKIEVA